MAHDVGASFPCRRRMLAPTSGVHTMRADSGGGARSSRNHRLQAVIPVGIGNAVQKQRFSHTKWRWPWRAGLV